MIKIKYLLLFVFAVSFLAACKRDSGPGFDAAAQFKTDTTAIRTFIKENNIPAVKHQSGIFYQVLEPGSGNINYSGSTQVTVKYSGSLLNGTVFDTSGDDSRTFALGGLIAAWQIGIPLIQKGGVIRLITPSYYAYGPSSQGKIGANSILDFKITLVNAN